MESATIRAAQLLSTDMACTDAAFAADGRAPDAPPSASAPCDGVDDCMPCAEGFARKAWIYDGSARYAGTDAAPRAVFSGMEFGHRWCNWRRMT